VGSGDKTPKAIAEFASSTFSPEVARTPEPQQTLYRTQIFPYSFFKRGYIQKIATKHSQQHYTISLRQLVPPKSKTKETQTTNRQLNPQEEIVYRSFPQLQKDKKSQPNINRHSPPRFAKPINSTHVLKPL
jgi:hypothetical protein